MKKIEVLLNRPKYDIPEIESCLIENVAMGFMFKKAELTENGKIRVEFEELEKNERIKRLNKTLKEERDAIADRKKISEFQVISASYIKNREKYIKKIQEEIEKLKNK
jgi:hypothetical protein